MISSNMHSHYNGCICSVRVMGPRQYVSILIQ